MRITSIVENTSSKNFPVEHGLSLYIEKANGQKVLFDMGQGSLFAENANAMSLSIAEINVAIISHGHYDHGGGLNTFLQENDKAKVFIHKDAFLPHYSLRDTGLHYIGLDKDLAGNNRIQLCKDIVKIDDSMTLFSNVQGNNCNPKGNRLLYGPSQTEKDTFCHEQNLLITEGSHLVLFAGCAHRGIINILREAENVAGKAPTHVLAGMHLVKSGLDEVEESQFIEALATELRHYDSTVFYTMHCTGQEQYGKLQALMGKQIEYLSCGDSAIISADE